MTDPSLPLQEALYARLRSDAALTALLAPHADADIGGSAVYDAVPQNARFPYVTLDREVKRNADHLNGRLDLRFVYLNVWSDHPGQQEVKQIIAAIDAALHEQPLPLSTGRVASVRVQDTDTARDADGRTYMGRVTLRIYTQH